MSSYSPEMLGAYETKHFNVPPVVTVKTETRQASWFQQMNYSKQLQSQRVGYKEQTIGNINGSCP